jgi:predicted amidophosphoribosyltransferase
VAVRYPSGPPTGFPNCGPCPYVQTGAAGICRQCVRERTQAVPEDHCPICCQALDGGTCRNALCNRATRAITRITAIQMLSGPLERAIKALKYNGRTGWALIFGRLLAAELEQNHRDWPDIVMPNPTWTGSGARPGAVQHTELVLRAAEREDLWGQFLWDTAGGLTLSGPTQATAASGVSLSQKRAAAEDRRGLLRLARPDIVQGRRVMLYDDVCTTGSQLDAVAQFLRDHGAADVEAVVLARRGWRG